MGLRVQPYGLETDTVEHAALLDVPETESLGFKNLDDYRVMAGGRDLAGHTVLSCEAICYAGAAYQTTWDRALQTLNSIYAAGVNMAMIHGFAYADAPGVTWPGFAAFSPYYNGAVGYGDAWGPRTPQWRHIRDVSDYLARTQLVLQTGTPRYDIVFLRQKGWASTGIGAPWATNNGIPIGWTHSFATPALLDLPLARRCAAAASPRTGPAYKVMIIGPDQFRGAERTMAVSTAKRVLELGRAGLPIVLPRRLVDGRAGRAGAARGDRPSCARCSRRSAALSTTRTIAVETEIPAALADLGITPDVRHDSFDGDDPAPDRRRRRPLLRRQRQARREPQAGAGHPGRLADRRPLRRGALPPRRLDRRDDRRSRSGSAGRPGAGQRRPAPRPGHDRGAGPAARGVRRPRPPSPAARSGSPAGPWCCARARPATTPSPRGGRIEDATVDRVREPVVAVVVGPGRRGLAAGRHRHARRCVRSATCTSMRWLPWSQVPGLADVSGVGVYTTVVDLGRDWTDADGAVLELGEVNDTFRVRCQRPPGRAVRRARHRPSTSAACCGAAAT